MFGRHRLVWLEGDGWRNLLSIVPDAWSASVERWYRSDWPLVVRRQDADIRSGELSVGLAQPPDPADGIKKRLPLRIPFSDVYRSAAPLQLRAAIPCAPDRWRPELEALAAEAEAAGITLRVFGSLALQAVTGVPYLTPGSDIDMLLQPDSRRQLADGIRLLSRFGARLPLDGEVVFSCGEAVAWKEWAAVSDSAVRSRVLAKSRMNVRLASTDELLMQLSGDHG